MLILHAAVHIMYLVLQQFQHILLRVHWEPVGMHDQWGNNPSAGNMNVDQMTENEGGERRGEGGIGKGTFPGGPDNGGLGTSGVLRTAGADACTVDGIVVEESGRN